MARETRDLRPRNPELFAQRADAWVGAQSILDTVEQRDGKSMTSAEAREYDSLLASIQRMTAQLEGRMTGSDDDGGGSDRSSPSRSDHDRRSQHGRLAKTFNAPAYDLPFDIAGRSSDEPDDLEFRSYLRTSDDAELRAQGVATGAAGGFLVPQGFRLKLVEVMKRTSAVRRVAEIITTDDGADLPWPTNDDTANDGAILAENTQAAELDVVLGQAMLGSYMYHSKITRVSFQLLQDSAFDVDKWLSKVLGMRIARIQNKHFTTGTGTAQPDGIVTSASIGKTGVVGQTVTVTYDDLVDLIHSVDPAYREPDPDVPGSCGFMMADTTFATVRKLKDADQRPLVEPDVQRGTPNSLLGYPVIINNDMPVMAANAKSILFGNFAAGYVIRDVTDLQVLRLNERYADFLQAGFLGWFRSDGTVQDTAAYKAYRNAAT